MNKRSEGFSNWWKKNDSFSKFQNDARLTITELKAEELGWEKMGSICDDSNP